jgi:hypothetical protein
MSVNRNNASINQELLLKFDFIFDRTTALFDPDSIDSVEILDSDRSTVLETITSANVTKISTGQYSVTTSSSWNTTSRNVYDRWNITVDGVAYQLVGATFIRDTSSPSIGIASYVTLVKQKVKAPTAGIALLTDPDDYETYILEAVKEYSKRRPYNQTTKETADGTQLFALPSDWDIELSRISQVEYPIDSNPPAYIENSKYEVVQLDTGYTGRFIGEYYPSNGQFFYLRYTKRHVLNDSSSTIPDAHKDAVANLAASISCHTLADLYSHTANSSIEADAIAYREKGDMFASRAKDLRKLYDNVVKEETSGMIGEIDTPSYWEGNKDMLNRNNRMF